MIIVNPFFLLLLLIMSSQVLGQSKAEILKEIHIELPGETEGTKVIDKGQWQLETGVLYNEFDTGNSAIIGQILLRFGLTKNWEVRLLSENGRERNRYIDETVQSTYPFAIGSKVSLVKDKGGLPDISILTYLHLPFASIDEKEKAYWSPLLLIAFENKLGEKCELEYNAGIQQDAYSSAWSFMLNASLNYQLTEPLEIFAEYYAQYHPAGLPQNNLGGGIAYQLNRWKFFLSAGNTLYDEEPNHFISGGAVLRLH